MVISKIKILYFILFVLLSLSCYQIYFFRIAGSYLPVTTYILLLLIPFIKINQFKDSLFVFYVLLFIITVFYYFKSSNIGAWLYQIFFGFIFLISYAASKNISDFNFFIKLVKVFLYSSLFNSLLIILFRYNGDFEYFFINNFLSFFKNPDRLSSEVGLNVFDSYKAGGVFDNANTAATFHLICYGLTIMIKNFLRRKIFLFVVIINFLAVLMSGSKSAIILLVFLSFLSLLLAFYFNSRGNVKIIKTLFLSIFTIFIYFSFSTLNSLFFKSSFGQQTSDTSDERYKIWLFAYDLFIKDPILGLGFGGWAEKNNQFGHLYSILANWPPHNSLIEAWANTGILGFFLSICIIFIIFWRVYVFFKLIDIQEGKGLLIALGSAILMPLGDPQLLLGPVQAAPILGVVFAYCYKKLKFSR